MGDGDGDGSVRPTRASVPHSGLFPFAVRRWKAGQTSRGSRVRPGGLTVLVHDGSGKGPGDVELRDVQSWILVEASRSPLVLLDADGRIVQMNRACTELADHTLAQAAGRPVWEVLPCVASELAMSRWATSRERGTAPPPSEQISIDDTGIRRRIRWSYIRIPQSEDEPARIIGTGKDVTSERIAEAFSRAEPKTDLLTGLANRDVFQSCIIEYADPRTGLGCGVLWCELDGFEAIANTLGGTGGDDLLVHIADRLTATVRSGDLVARVGAHAFAVLVPAVGMLQIRALAVRIDRCIRTPLRLPTQTVRLDASIGLAVLAPGDVPDAAVQAAQAHARAVTSHREGRGRREHERRDSARPH